MKTIIRITLAAFGVGMILAALNSSCATVRLNNADRLMARPDFKAAKDAAPEFTRDALKTINQLEHTIESK